MATHVYSIDSSALLHGWVRRYPPDNFPALWDNMDALIDQGRLRATDEVRIELTKQDDELSAWCKAHSTMFVPIDEPIQERVAAILTLFPSLVDIDRGRGGADPFVIALAELNSFVVISEEIRKPTKPRIPDVCDALRVPCHELLWLIQAEGWRF